VPGIVIVGGGIAGAQTAMALRWKEYDGPITIVGAESAWPYQRPPLSKDYLKGLVDEAALQLRPAQFWREKSIDVILGAQAVDVDRERKQVILADGRTIVYEHLVLATGARNRSLPGMPVQEGVLDLRTIDDARGLLQRLAPGTALVVVGGGFIGMEVAAATRQRGIDVTVVETLDRIMARLLSRDMSEFFATLHERNGVQIITGRRVERFIRDDEACGVVLDDGRRVPASVVLIAIGVSPNVELAERSGLEVSDGIVVDSHLLTSDPNISAIGDCAYYPCAVSGRSHRLESIQNATDQAHHVAARLTGEADAYAAVPWFWTEQYGRKLQIAGVAPTDADSVLRATPGAGAFSVCRFDGGRLAAVESLDRPADHIAARKLLGTDAATEASLTRVADASTPLKSLIPSAAR
jgi:3-phenylpropionate/trans-cinnamate dioxygenase ferredoxin reductase subunit